jgi:hypothetical protein
MGDSRIFILILDSIIIEFQFNNALFSTIKYNIFYLFEHFNQTCFGYLLILVPTMQKAAKNYFCLNNGGSSSFEMLVPTY